MLEERAGTDVPIRYEYDSQGRKSVIENLQLAAVASQRWLCSELGRKRHGLCSMPAVQSHHYLQ